MQRVVQLAVIFVLGPSLSCGGGGESGSPPPPPPPPANAIQVTLQPAQVFQTWEAWRGVLLGPNFVDNTGTDRDAPPQVISEALDALADLGINGVRLELHHNQNLELTNDDSNPNNIVWSGFNFAQTYNLAVGGRLFDPVKAMTQMILPLRNRVLNRGEPFSIYVSLIYGKANFPAHWLSNPEEYAEMAQACILWLQNKSPNPPGFQVAITPDYWVIANEPDLGGFSPTEIAGFIPALGRRFAGMVGVNTRIQTTETASPNMNYLNPVVNATGVSPFVGLVSFHSYDYNVLPTASSFTIRNQTRTKAQSMGVRTAMTEVCCRSSWGGGSYTMGLGWARDIFWNATEADVSIWEPLALLTPCQTVGCTGGGNLDPVNIDKSLTNIFKFPAFYALRQFSHYIRPGFQRVGFACTQNCPPPDLTIGEVVKPLAFKSAGGKIVAVVINDQTVSQAISLLSLSAGTYDITGVDPTSGQSPVTYPTQTIGAGQALTVTFPARAILTFVQR
jgi:hypothetical protein